MLQVGSILSSHSLGKDTEEVLAKDPDAVASKSPRFLQGLENMCVSFLRTTIYQQ